MIQAHLTKTENKMHNDHSVHRMQSQMLWFSHYTDFIIYQNAHTPSK